MKKIVQGMLLALLFTYAASSFAEEVKMAAIVAKPAGIGMPKTGQTVSYLANDDGAYQKGLPVTGARYKDNGDGTITDNATGLMWVKDPSQCDLVTPYLTNAWASALNTPKSRAWADAISKCEALVYAGHNDWRLPNIKELSSIVDYSKVSPSIDTTMFVNTMADWYWSSTTTGNSVMGTISAWTMYFGDSAGANTTVKWDGRPYVRPVRGGQ